MSDYKPEVGHRVRVVLEGVIRTDEDSPGFGMGAREDSNYINPNAAHVVSVERLPDPEPEWQAWDAVLDADGLIWERNPDGGWLGRGYVKPFPLPFPDDFPLRPLTLLVRDGKAVQS